VYSSSEILITPPFWFAAALDRAVINSLLSFGSSAMTPSLPGMASKGTGLPPTMRALLRMALKKKN